jgi:hypothetical protein
MGKIDRPLTETEQQGIDILTACMSREHSGKLVVFALQRRGGEGYKAVVCLARREESGIAIFPIAELIEGDFTQQYVAPEGAMEHLAFMDVEGLVDGEPLDIGESDA